MNGKKSVIVIGIFVVAAVLLGLLLMNKGDGPVAGLMLASSEASSIEAYGRMASDNSKYVLLSNEFGGLKEKYHSGISTGQDLYADVHFVECLKGTEFKLCWSLDGKTVKEEVKKLEQDRQGVISYRLEKSLIEQGDWSVEILQEDQRLFKYSFQIKQDG
ncbi:MAG: hypothetical protein HGA22_04960 [Clostridiales bacterium]|nr:hypothetical protein [Clostridiales bacterium]